MPLLDKTAGTVTAPSPNTKSWFRFPAAGTAVSELSAVVVPAKLSTSITGGTAKFSGLFASGFGKGSLHEFCSCGRNTGLPRINLGEGFLSQDFLRFRPTHGSRHDGHRDLKIICVLGGWRGEGGGICGYEWLL